MESATTNLSELTCDFVRLWDGQALQHRDVRELFVHQASVISPVAVEVQVGQEVDTELVYPAPTDEQVPSLKGLLAYIDARETGGGTVKKYYTTNRKHFSLQEGAVQQVRQHKTVHTHRTDQLNITEHHTTLKKTHRTQRIFLDVYAPVLLVRRVTNVRITRPIYIIAP
jgi:hypothetical protein